MTDPDNLNVERTGEATGEPNEAVNEIALQHGDPGLPETATEGFDVDTEDDADAEPGTDDPGEPHDGDTVTPDQLEDDDDEDH